MADDDPESAWTETYCLRPYNPYTFMGSRNPKFVRATDGRLLDLKDGYDYGITNAAKDLQSGLECLDLDEGTILVIVPGHRARESNEGSPLAKAAHALVKLDSRFVARVDAIIRTDDVQKKTGGGDRSIETNLQSTKLSNPASLKGKVVVILDDTVTSGNSLAAARQLVEKAGAAKVATVGIGRTVKYL